MSYPEYMCELILKVEKTRQRRLEESPPLMNSKEREELLEEWHPDYKLNTKRALRVGKSKGEWMPHEVADILEAWPLIEPEDVDLSPDWDVDILIIGGGGAGSVAALFAYYEGILPERILIATKLRHGDSNSMMAQGGIQAADRPEDSPLIHYLDIIGGGHFANKPELAAALAMDAPKIIKWHEELGVMYDKEGGRFVEKHGGGTSKRRMHSAKDYTGKEIMTVLRDEIRNLKIPVLEFSPAVELCTDTHQVAGAVLFNLETREYLVIKAKAVILATGGFGRLHIQDFPTTNHYGATADGLVLAYRVGAKLRDMDSVQYHPTGVAYPEALVGQLVTEKVRGMGAMPVNCDGEAFVYPLEPRDVESAAFIRECYGRGKGVETPTGMRGVWLDSPMIEEIHGKGTIKKNLAAMWRMMSRFGIDMTKDPILVFPTLHYQNGGVEIDQWGFTSVKGLFAAGEVTGGVHGKNRLMGNSLMDYNVFGRRAGISAARYAKGAKVGKLSLNHVKEYKKMLKDVGISTSKKAPILLPEYRGEKVLSKALDIYLT
jgi:succinate dehydrogenase / fumarate reductase flavoprotein subunit